MFGDRKRLFALKMVGVGLLPVQRNRIVQGSGGSPVKKIVLDRIAVFYPHDIQVVDTPGPCRFGGNYDLFGRRKQAGIVIGIAPAQGIPCRKFLQLNAQKPALDCVKPAVIPSRS